MILRKYFCCLCYSDKRKKLRQQAKKLELIANQQKEEVDSSARAATKIQCLIRRFLARVRLKKKYEDLLQAANDYWVAEILMAKLEKERLRREIEITKILPGHNCDFKKSDCNQARWLTLPNHACY
jgi:hypothetical protein